MQRNSQLQEFFSLFRYSGGGLGWGFGRATQKTPTLTLPRSAGRRNKRSTRGWISPAVPVVFFALLLASVVLAAPADQPAPLPADAQIDQVLDALDQRGKSLKEFTADVKLTEEDPAFGISSFRIGKVAFQRKDDNDARIRVNFDRKVTDKIAKSDPKEYLLDNGWLTDRDDKNKIEVRRQVVKSGQKINLLKLGEGPFPLPIGQSKEDVHKNFDVQKPPPGKDDPANTIHLKLTPKPGSSMARRLKSLDVWVDSKTNMPVRIDTTDASGGETRRTDLTNLVVNPQPPLKNSDFELPKIDQATWSIKTEPYQE